MGLPHQGGRDSKDMQKMVELTGEVGDPQLDLRLQCLHLSNRSQSAGARSDRLAMPGGMTEPQMQTAPPAQQRWLQN